MHQEEANPNVFVYSDTERYYAEILSFHLDRVSFK